MEEIYRVQKEFQIKANNDVTSQKFRNEMFYALIVEVVEAGNETPWKSWKKGQKMNNDEFAAELVDVQLFLINLVISSGKSWPEFEELLKIKQSKNVERQKNGY